PPLPEQRKIAQILETVDKAIEKTEKIIEKYKRIKQGLMQDLLTKGIDEKGNIRSEKTHKFKDSPLGRIPEEWEVVRLGEIGEIIDGDWILEKYYTESGVRLIQVGDIGIGKLLNKSNHYISEKSARHLKVKFLKEGQILISRLPDPIGRSCLVPKLPYPAITAVDVSILTVYEDISEKTFIVQILNTDLFFGQCSNLASGTTRSRISRSNLKNLLIPLPPLSEQKRIAEILSQIDQAIEKEEKYKEKLERLKKGLMEDLLTGKVRVNKLVEEENHELA
ncbi:MAG: restriction endonuclease subunit S, partial [Thermocrinis sp.]|nr:restriction endonuclease subunit S [Thermocrinis sp.]